MVKLKNTRLFVFMLAAAVLAGCNVQTPTPGVARKGDLVTLQVGGAQAHWGGASLEPADMSVTITDAGGNVYPVEVMSVYSAKPDSVSGYLTMLRVDPQAKGLYDSVGVPTIFDKVVLIDVALKQPYSSQALPLVPGNATISLTSPKLLRPHVFQNFEQPVGTYPIEIISGDGQVVNTGRSFFQTVSNASIKVTGLDQAVIAGAAEFTFRYDPAAFGAYFPVPAVSSSDPHIQLMSARSDEEGGTKLMKIVISNPNGFTSPASWQEGKSFQADMAVDLSWWNANFTTVAQAQQALQLVGSKVYDMQGNVIQAASGVLEFRKVNN